MCKLPDHSLDHLEWSRE